MRKLLKGKHKCCICGNGYTTKERRMRCESQRLKPSYGIGDVLVKIDNPSRKVRATGFSTDHRLVFYEPETRGRLDKCVGGIDLYRVWEMPPDVKLIRGKEARALHAALEEGRPAGDDVVRPSIPSGRKPKPCPICNKDFFESRERAEHRKNAWDPGFGFGNAVLHRNRQISGVVHEIDHDHETMVVKVRGELRKFRIWDEHGISFWHNADSAAA